MENKSEKSSQELEKLYKRPDYLKNLKKDNVWFKIAPLVTDQIDLSFVSLRCFLLLNIIFIKTIRFRGKLFE